MLVLGWRSGSPEYEPVCQPLEDPVHRPECQVTMASFVTGVDELFNREKIGSEHCMCAVQ